MKKEVVFIATSGIYKIENVKNGKVYIGQSGDIDIRLRGHKNTLKNNKHFNRYLQRAWNKHGEENFTFETLEECNADIINDREVYWINLYDSCNNINGYNIDYGGTKNAMSDEHKLNMSIAKNGVHNKTPPIYITYLEIEEILKQPSKNKKILLFAMLVYSKRYADNNGIFYMSYKQMIDATGIKERKTFTTIVNRFDRMGIVKRISKDTNITNSYKIIFDVILSDKTFLINEDDNCREIFHKCLLEWFSIKDIKKLCGKRHYFEISKFK